jgi:hypothetical protein
MPLRVIQASCGGGWIALQHRVTNVVALLCPEPRLNRLLRLALEADGLCARDWPGANAPVSSHVSAVVADLDSLGWHPRTATEKLSALGIDTTVPRLLICVLPPEPAQHHATKAAYLQPPFSPGAFVGRLHALLDL